MKTQVSPPKNSRTPVIIGYSIVCLAWVATLLMGFTANNDDTIRKYHLTSTGLHYLLVGFSLPLLLIWLSILFAGLSFYHYAHNITGSKESPGFRYIAYGLFVMLAGSIAGSIISSLQPIMSHNSADPANVRTHFVIISNYVSVISSLAFYGFLFLGSQSLLASIGSRLSWAKRFMPLLIPFALLAIAYIFLIFSNPSRQFTTDPTVSPTFGLPDSLIVLTVALPFVVSWLLGAAALVGLYQYRAKSKGIVYKLLFKKLIVGMTTLISLTIVLQLIAQFSNFWSSQGFTSILGVVTILYIVLVYAFIVVAQGARQLNKIETLGAGL